MTYEDVVKDNNEVEEGIDVTILFYKGAAEKTFHNVKNIYEKDTMLCLRSGDNILKIPMCNILYVKHKHGMHIGANGNI